MTPTSPTHLQHAGGHLLVLTCNAALRDLDAAEEALDGNDGRAARARVRTAQRILLELMAALDPAVAPHATDALRALYQHLFDRLDDPNATSNPAILREARHTLRRIRDAWAAGGERVDEGGLRR